MIKKDPTSKLKMKTRILLTRWRTKDYIDQSTYKKIVYRNISDGDLSRFYGFLKVHKDDCPLRMIVSCINNSLFNLSTFLKNKSKKK